MPSSVASRILEHESGDRSRPISGNPSTVVRGISFFHGLGSVIFVIGLFRLAYDCELIVISVWSCCYVKVR